jgi:hypothetical protein
MLAGVQAVVLAEQLLAVQQMAGLGARRDRDPFVAGVEVAEASLRTCARAPSLAVL